MQIWLVITEDREGDSSAVAHRSRAGAMHSAREQLRECLDPEHVDDALADLGPDDATGDTGAGDPNARIWVTVHSSNLLD